MAGVARRVIGLVNEVEIKEGGGIQMPPPFLIFTFGFRISLCEIAAHLSGARNDKRKIVVCENRDTKM